MAEFLSTQQAIQINQWSTYREQITLALANGTPINVTGYTFVSQIRILPSDVAPIATFTVNILNAANGVIERVLTVAQVTAMFTAAVAAGLPAGATPNPVFAYCDLIGTPSGGDTTQLMQGVAIVNSGFSH